MTPPYPFLTLPPPQQSPSISQSLLFHPTISYRHNHKSEDVLLDIIAHDEDFSTASSATHWQYLQSLEHAQQPTPRMKKRVPRMKKRVRTHSPLHLPKIYLARTDLPTKK